MKGKKRIKPKKKTSEVAAKVSGSPLGDISDEITEIAMKAIDGVDPLMAWQYFSLQLMSVNDWNEEDLKAEIDKLLLDEPTPVEKLKSNRKTGNKRKSRGKSNSQRQLGKVMGSAETRHFQLFEATL